MLKKDSRREFIVKTLLGTTATLLSPTISGAISNNFQTQRFNDFSLGKIENVIENESFINHVFEKKIVPDKYSYSMFWISQEHWVKRGELIFSKKSDGKVNHFYINCTRNATPEGAGELRNDIVYQYITRGEVICADDVSLSLKSWNYETRLIDSERNKTIENTLVKGTGSVKNGQILIRQNRKISTNNIDSKFPITFKWLFIELIRKMHLQKSDFPAQFSVIDEFDFPVGKQSLSFKRKLNVSYKGNEQDLYAYLLVGHGIIPTVYWLNQSGLVFLVISGLEAHYIN